MITLSERAASQIRQLLKGRTEVNCLRVGVDKGGCSGMSYNLALGAKREGDQIISKDGVEVAIDPNSIQYFGDSMIDYDDSLSGAGFRIVNANAERSCGCGKSFEPHKKVER